MTTMYKGFSTYNRIKKFRVTDIDLIKQNLYNHFNTKKGEKLMQPNFGSIIWNLLFEPLTEEIKGVIIEDVRRVASYDPRCRVTNVVVTQFEYGLQIELDILYVTNNQKDFLRLNFDNNAQRLTRG